MLIIWKGKYMIERDNERDNLITNEIHDDYNNGHCGCECCHCKKIFMMLVLLILTFIAGIMVGNCGRCRYADKYYDNYQYTGQNNPKKFHRGAPHANPNPQMNRAYSTPQSGGFIMEIDEID